MSIHDGWKGLGDGMYPYDTVHDGTKEMRNWYCYPPTLGCWMKGERKLDMEMFFFI